MVEKKKKKTWKRLKHLWMFSEITKVTKPQEHHERKKEVNERSCFHRLNEDWGVIIRNKELIVGLKTKHRSYKNYKWR